ncbi:MAG: phosphodiester glycosidase family protein [Mycobacteriales bacterium]
MLLRRRRVAVAAGLVLVLIFGWLGDSVGQALTAPGTDSVAARLAEWGRLHHFSWIINALERVQYDLNKPRTGGTPHGGVPTASAASLPGSTGRTGTGVSLGAGPAPIAPFVSPALPGEGQWQTVETVHGLPAVRVAYLRPDAQHTSYLTGVMWMDPSLVRFELHPGTAVPGGSGWSLPPDVPVAERGALLATFNSGFTLQDSRGGYYAEGRTVQALRPGIASLVIYKNGTATVGMWGRDVTMGPNVAAVRQNLDLLIDGGQIAPDINVNNTAKWGYTLGNRYFVWRSGLGVTASGKVILVAGAALSTYTLARILQRAGAVRAMELDINPEWVSAMYYLHPQPGVAVPTKLTSDQQRPADRYFSPTARDFVAVLARP